jgi:IMP cyclohydrolase
MQLVYDGNVKPHETITEVMEDEVLYVGHIEPEEISVDYVVQKCQVVLVTVYSVETGP